MNLMTMSICVEERTWDINMKVKFKMNSTPFPAAGMSKMASRHSLKPGVIYFSVNGKQFMKSSNSKNSVEIRIFNHTKRTHCIS